mmetsp:Transcript_20177/g.17865  ORF Transcript_20177/g.17865 Transcript_20177/m.17865 type:complete len:202 (-) Transcript_20177:168-773(-)
MSSIEAENKQQQMADNENNDNNDRMELDELDIEYETMELKVHKHRKHNSYHHPKFMLNDDENDPYISAINPHFKQNESDWIILKNKDTEKIIVPLFGKMQCNGYIQDVKSMRIEIGNFEENKWIPLNKDNATVALAQSKELQKFEFDVDDENIVTISQLMKEKNYRHFKLTLTENHGATEEMYSKFAICRFKLYGIIVGKY